MDFTKATWRKSTRSGGNSDMCVEVAFTDEGVGVRDSKDQTGPVLGLTKNQFADFVTGIKAGDFDL